MFLLTQNPSLCKSFFVQTAFANDKVFCPTFFQKSWQVWTTSTNINIFFLTPSNLFTKTLQFFTIILLLCFVRTLRTLVYASLRSVLDECPLDIQHPQTPTRFLKKARQKLYIMRSELFHNFYITSFQFLSRAILLLGIQGLFSQFHLF